MEDAMAKALEVNDNTAKNQERQPQQQSGDKPNSPTSRSLRAKLSK